MSMFPMTDIPFAGAKAWEKYAAGFASPRELSSAFDASTNPAAGAMAFSMMSVGMTSHLFGTWIGLMTGAAQSSQRMFAAGFVPTPTAPAPKSAPTVAAPKPRPAPPTLVEKPEIPAEPAARPVKAAKPVEKAAEAVAKLETAAVEAAPPAVEPAAAPAQPSGELMPEDFRAPKAMDRPATPDDLKAISGIGPKLETVLNGLGIWTYGQIADLSREEIAWLDDYLSFKGRIERDAWLTQAAKLAAGPKG